MTIMKRLLVSTIAVLLALSPGIEYTDAKSKNDTLSTDEIYTQLNELRNNGATIEEGKKFLKKHGIIVEKVETMKFDMDGNTINPENFSSQAVDSSAVTVNNWINYNRDRSRYYIYGELTRSSDHEWEEGDYDVLSINFDKSIYDYMTHGESNESLMWASDLTEGNNGTIIFSVKDNWYTTNEYVSGWATVRPIAEGYGDTNIKYHHSYLNNETNHSASINFETPKTVGVDYTIDWTTTQKSWSKADDSTVYVYYNN